jgi:methionyl-tRNA formyltransferase
MSKALKVVFFGTPDFAVASLQKIVESHHQVVGVVTVADKASGRGQKINQSAVKKYALAQNLSIFQPEKLKDETFLRQIKQLEADVFVVVAFRMIPQVLYSMPQHGTFNLHASLLPDYRGAAPINYAIINNETVTGVTSFLIDDKIDTGHILLQAKMEISAEDNAGTLHDKLMLLGGETVVKTLDALAQNQVLAKAQHDVDPSKTAKKIFKEDCQINWQAPAQDIHNLVRGLSPYPAAFTYIMIEGASKMIKIYAGQWLAENHQEPIGSLMIDKKQCAVYVKGGIYQWLNVQLEGKKAMPIKDFLNGFRSFENISLKI